MNTFDQIALWTVSGLGFLAAALRALLAKRQGAPLSAGWTVQGFVFPGLLLLSLLLYYMGTDVVLPVLAVALAEELVGGALRRRWEKRDAE